MGKRLRLSGNHYEGNAENQEKTRMPLNAIVSYDDTQNDLDALMLGRTLRDAGAKLTLAYVRHATHRQAAAEQLSQH